MLTANLDSESPVREKYDVVELTKQGTGESLPVTIYRFLRNQLLMTRAIVRRDEDVMLFFGATAYFLPILTARLFGKRVIVEPRGDVPLSLRLAWENQIPSSVARLLASTVKVLEHMGYIVAHAIITYSPSMADELGLRRYDKKLYTEGARYVDTEQFSPAVSFDDRPMSVGYLGRLDTEKDIPTLAEVAKRLPEGITFRFIGDGDDREYVERRLADEIAAGDVELTGWVEHAEVPVHLNNIRLLLLTSEPTEGLPTSILEAFACGTPVYTKPVSGIPDVVREGETGIHMTDDNPEAIVETIQIMLTDESLSKMSERCRLVANTEFSFEAAVERYRSILRSV